MVGILDNRKTSELVIQVDDDLYEKINPETLASVVSNESEVDANVQEHIDDKDIHFSKTEFEELNSVNLTAENIIAGNNVVITREEGTNNITITASDHPTEGFLKKADIQAADETITIIPSEDSNVIQIKANIEDIPTLKETLKQENIKAGNDIITIEYAEDSNDVIISSSGKLYTPGEGIEIDENAVITNTKPDQEVILTAGNNVKIDGTYPNYTITASSGAMIDDWKENELYFEGQFLVYENSIYRCKEQHTSGEQFEYSYWELIAGYKVNRAYYLDNENEITSIVLPKMIPSKEVLTINVSGVILQAQNYQLEPDQQTVTFFVAIPSRQIIEVSFAGNEIINMYDTGANITLYGPNQAYAEGNLTIYNDAIFRCLETHITGEEFDQTKWQMISGYVKDMFTIQTEEVTSIITLPYEVYNKQNIMINVDGRVLLSSEYEISADSMQIYLTPAIEVEKTIEVSLFSNMVLKQLNVPLPINKPHHILRSNVQEDGYELITSNTLKEQMGLTAYTNFEGNANKYYKVNEDETDVEFVNINLVARDLNIRKIAQGFETVVTKGTTKELYPPYNTRENDLITIKPGSVMAEDGRVMMILDKEITKDPNTVFTLGDNGGAGINNGQGDVWTQPIMTSAFTPYGQVVASSELSDREAWRAMDVYPSEGNGWLANTTTATWKYLSEMPLYVTSIDFYGQESTLNNRPKDISVFVGEETNIKASFVAPNENLVHVHVELNNPEWNPVIGLKFNSSYGESVGMKHIVINALYPTLTAKNDAYHIFLISNNDATQVDVVTSDIKDFELPDGFTKKAKIGSFRTDNEWNIYNVYPEKDIIETYANGINGKMDGNSIETWVNKDEVAMKVIEQWGYDTPINGYISFPKEYTNECFYVNISNGNVTEISKDKFKVSSNNAIYWNAKGC